jgi:hypothetical protein
MKIAYLAFAYTNPRLLRREIETLSSPDCGFFLHIDRKSNINDFANISGDNVFFLEERVVVYWAEFSGVEAILALLNRALRDPASYDYFVLLSGSEYPLKSSSCIHRFFEDNQGTEFMDLVVVPNAQAGKKLSHINTFCVDSRKPLRQLILRSLSRAGFAQRDYRKFLGSLVPYSGHTWWALTRSACRYLIGFIDGSPQVTKFFRNVPQPEESFIQTILGNSSFLPRIRRNLVFEDWSAASRRPAMIDGDHLARFKRERPLLISDVWGQGEVLFARKFSDESLHLVDEMDELIRSD